MQTLTPSSRPAYAVLFSLPVLVAALGYFVDVYDLLLFSIVRVPSLKDMGLSEADVSRQGASILNWQQAGLLLGGILWGVLGDKRGRLSVLFGSIITYSLANIACGFVQDVPTYAGLRFVAGLGLAGELGAGITLVSEILPKELRSLGTSLIAGVGLFGAVVAYLTVVSFDWRTAYFIGGGMGLALLLLRVSVFESGMYLTIKGKSVERGNFFLLFTNRTLLLRYLRCMGLAVPTYFVIGILATFSNEFGKALGLSEPVVAGRAVMFTYIGMAVGDLASGPLSQWLHSRRKAIGLLMALNLVLVAAFLLGVVRSAEPFYWLCLALGFSIGYIALFLTVAAEQFGTNLRATATTSIANNVRATTLLTIPLFQYLKTSLGALGAAGLVGALCFLISFWALATVEETHGKDLNYID
ncbi:MFS transporter [Tellurirhabdus rosea]|uniref:MFS transporter n=1 Tax=Tellurirhabdus rosea TaxID=2674997 RepID=UPI00225A2BE7|nr:MFS transporter [Tellurirhabdus rosea]